MVQMKVDDELAVKRNKKRPVDLLQLIHVHVRAYKHENIEQSMLHTQLSSA